VNCHGRFYFVTMTPPSLSQFGVAAINHLLAQETWARTKLLAHAGKLACFDVGMVVIRLKVAADGMLEAGAETDLPTVTIRVNMADLPLIMQHRERAFSYVKIDGDADFANTISQISQSLRWEAEADLSPLLGEMAATRVVSTAKSLADHVKLTHQKLAENTAEYFLEENPLLMRRQAVVDLTADVTKLRDDVERMAKRIEKLKKMSGAV
jgi:ubiquinone biosynthesis protein UbiJ